MSGSEAIGGPCFAVNYAALHLLVETRTVAPCSVKLAPMAKESKSILEIQELILAEFRARKCTAAVQSIRVNRHDVDGEGANWGACYWMNVGTSGLGDSEKALRQILRRLRGIYTAAEAE